MRMRSVLACLSIFASMILLIAKFGPTALCDEPMRFRLEKNDDHVVVYYGDSLVTKYWLLSVAKPILWPLLGPNDAKMTRDYPMLNTTAGETRDHVHHRSLWMTHGDVNGVDYWTEVAGHGMTVHREFNEMDASAKSATIAATNDWQTQKGEKVLVEKRKFVFQILDGARLIDCDFEFTPVDKPVHFGDTKEGSFGIRVAETMSLKAKRGGKIVNSLGQTADQIKGHDEVWGKPANWVDYTGPIGDKTYGIAILCHPISLNSPGRWHVRDYGLFAHNPFGVKDFVPGQKGGYTLPLGQTMHLRYRVILHAGDTEAANIAAAWASYISQ